MTYEAVINVLVTEENETVIARKWASWEGKPLGAL